MTTTTDQGVVIVRFTVPELTDQIHAREIGCELIQLVDQGAEKLLLSLEGVSFMSSAMVGQLFVLSHKCRAHQVSLKICCVPPVIRQVFGIVRLPDFIELHDNLAGALASFASDATPVKRPPSTADDHRAAAEAGKPDAQFELAMCYEQGRGVPDDEDEAQRWLEQAARQGHLEAQYQMGRAYAYGIRVAQDYFEAIRWYSPAAERGHADAQYAMGMSHYYGVGVPEDADAATRWYRLAAAQGHVRAQEELAKRNPAPGAN